MLSRYFFLGLLIMGLTACDDSSNTTNTSSNSGNSSGTYSLSGQVIVAGNTAKDNDINDINAPNLSDNNSIYEAQSIPNPVILGGYVNKPNAGYNGKYKQTGDEEDFFEIDLRKGQVINLFVANTNLSGNDIDFSLLDASGTIWDASVAEGAVETLIVPFDGHFYVKVYAYTGASNYVLSVGQNLQAQSTTMRLSSDFVPHEITIRMAPTEVVQAQNTLSAFGMVTENEDTSRRMLYQMATDQISLFNTSDLTFATPELAEKYETLMAVKRLNKRPEILSASPNYILKTFATPNDSYYQYQWNYNVLNLPSAWEVSKGSSDVIVAVIDTGVLLNHPDLKGKLVQGYDFISNRSNALDGNGIDSDPNDPGDQASPAGSTFHGTHVAGIVGALTNNRTGIAGVGWNTKIMPLRVFGMGGSGTDYDIEQAMRYAAGLSNDSGRTASQRADVINLSLGGPTIASNFQEVIDLVRGQGVIVVAAAGNEGSTAAMYPASLEGVVSVSAVNIYKDRASYSNHNRYVDVAAPGGDSTPDSDGDGQPDQILSTLGGDERGYVEYKYSYLMGTSMATPHVAGVVALMKAVNHNLTPNDFDDLLYKGKLTSDVGSSGHDNDFGYGLLDAKKAVLAAAELGNNYISEPMPELVVTPKSLNFGLSDDRLTLTLSNGGGGQLAVSSVTEDSRGFLSVYGNGLGQYTITVNRDNLTAGTHTATITIQTNANTVKIPIILQAGQGGVTGDAGHHYILLLDASTSSTVQEIRANASYGRYTYQFNNVAPGHYKIVAGSDFDNDGYICGMGEACGSFLTINEPNVIQVRSNMLNINFSTGFNINFLSQLSVNDTIQTEQVGFSRLKPYREITQ